MMAEMGDILSGITMRATIAIPFIPVQTMIIEG
jgi:hypothetical protein